MRNDLATCITIFFLCLPVLYQLQLLDAGLAWRQYESVPSAINQVLYFMGVGEIKEQRTVEFTAQPWATDKKLKSRMGEKHFYQYTVRVREWSQQTLGVPCYRAERITVAAGIAVNKLPDFRRKYIQYYIWEGDKPALASDFSVKLAEIPMLLLRNYTYESHPPELQQQIDKFYQERNLLWNCRPRRFPES
ncbi:hypothetical protein [Calycomorphotria hydatis]|uniref:Uncharacterized protein n=1 Tax=Calycomorphotria hydatis TaxID=2528027 RepID=A0A517TBL3_9PLAN|nr:hypothetical protein [Calycomorphotria hydatis]QDT65757.1 hypothetical protein V22_30180 [Calycomorphotria hydatis]